MTSLLLCSAFILKHLSLPTGICDNCGEVNWMNVGKTKEFDNSCEGILWLCTSRWHSTIYIFWNSYFDEFGKIHVVYINSTVMDVDSELDQDLLSRFNALGTTDRDVLITELQRLLNFQLSQAGCVFFLDMTNW